MKLRISGVGLSEILVSASVFCMVVLSGCVYFTQVIRFQMTIIMLCVTIGLMICRHTYIKYQVGCVLVAFIFSLVLNFIINIFSMSIANLLDYTLLIIELFCVAGIACSVRIEEFENKYCKIIEGIAIISLICYGIQIMNIQLVNQLADYEILDGYIISWFHTWGWTYIFNRNAGPFWEPGAFQGYLSLAILFLLKSDNLKRHYAELILLAITIVSTMSTTGYLILGVLSFYFIILDSRQTIKKSRTPIAIIVKIFLIFVLAIILLQTLFTSSTVVSKFTTSNESYNYRLLHITKSFTIMMEKPMFGYGIMSNSLVDAWKIFGIPSNSVGIFAILQYFGLTIGGIYILLNLWAVLRVYNSLNKIVVIVVFMILHSTEALLTYPVYFSFIFYGIVKQLEFSKECMLDDNIGRLYRTL